MKIFVKRDIPIAIGDNIKNAADFYSRLMGLMFRKRLDAGSGLLLCPCPQIHTFFMNFPIDALYLSLEGVVLGYEKALRPCKAGKFIPKTRAVLELPAGTIDKYGIMPNERLLFKA